MHHEAGSEDMKNNQPLKSSAEAPARRTFLLKLLVFGYVVLAWFGWVRLYAVFANEPVLARYLSQGMLAYIAIGGVVWGMAGLTAAILLWIGRPFAAPFSRAAALFCFAGYWLDFFILSKNELSRSNLPFMLIFTVLALAFAWLVPALPKEKRFLRRKAS